jgi:hypothetical protein
MPSASHAWEIAGTGDFDGDNDADILWRHDEGCGLFGRHLVGPGATALGHSRWRYWRA